MTRLFAGTPFDIPPQCEFCGEPETECECTDKEKADRIAKQQVDAKRLPPSDQTAQVSVQKRKGGRRATVIEGLTADANELPELLTRLQAACGTGGTVKSKEDLIELQGDHADTVRTTLKELGYRV